MSGCMNKHKSKYLNTARLMNEALILLLNDKDFPYITVKELCRKAGVNRSTFYLHYETMNDLLNETLSYTTQQFNSNFLGLQEDKTEKNISPIDDVLLIDPKYLFPYLDFLREHKKLYLASITHKEIFKTSEITEKALNQIIFPILSKLNIPTEEQKYLLAFYMNGTKSVIFEWVKNGCIESNQYIYDLLMTYIFNGKPFKI